jgi:hypothetical protein
VEKIKSSKEIQVCFDGKNTVLKLLLAKLPGTKGDAYDFEARLDYWNRITIEHWEAHSWKEIRIENLNCMVGNEFCSVEITPLWNVELGLLAVYVETNTGHVGMIHKMCLLDFRERSTQDNIISISSD